MTKKSKERILLLVVFTLVCAAPMAAQTVDFSKTETDVKGAVTTFVTIAGLLVGVVGFGRAAWKFSQGESDAIQSLIAALVANGIAMIAQTLA